MSNIQLNCPICKKDYERYIGHYNRAVKDGKKMYCSKSCFSVGRKLDFDKHLKTPEQLKAEKSEYDRAYREKNEERLKVKRHEWFIQDYAKNPEKYKAIREKKMASHVEYCRRPEYKEYKKEYDQLYRAKKDYGEFAEAFLLTEQIFSLIPNHAELKQSNRHQLQSSQKRKRQWKHLMQNH